MSDGGKLRIGMDGARELEMQVESVDDAVASLEKGLTDKEGLIWLTDDQGGRHGIVAARLAFVEVARASDRAIGFG
jgi:hypothetical protein